MANLEKRGNRYRIVFRFGRRKYARTLKTCEERAGAAACRAFDFWSIGPPWESCAADTPGATEHLNRLYDEAKWNSKKQVWEFNGIESPKVMP